MLVSPTITDIERGFAIIAGAIDPDTIESLIDRLSLMQNRSKLDRKGGATYGVRDIFNLVPQYRQVANSDLLRSIVVPILGEEARAVRGIFFDKLPEANWRVPWHQDLTIAVKEYRDVAGFDRPTIKAGIVHLQPPREILERMLTVRIHLDDADETNGALKVIPNSHLEGYLSVDRINELKSQTTPITCSVKKGDILLMMPLLLHSSTIAVNPSHRRVLHFEYAAATLPDGLQWHEQI